MRRILSIAGAAALLAATGVSAVGAQPTPPTRFFGTASPDGATITAMVGTTNCGTGTVTGGTYSVDVASASTRPGCGTDGATVTFMIGNARATQTGTFQTGAFVNLPLTAAQATATATAAPPTATRTPTAAATTTPTRTPTTAPTTAPTRTPTAAPAPQRPAAPAAPPAAPALPRTGTSSSADAGTGLLGAIAALTVLGGGLFVARRRR